MPFLVGCSFTFETPLLEAGDPHAVRVLAHAGVGVALVPGSWLVTEPAPPAGVASLAPPVPVHSVSLLLPTARVAPAVERLAAALHR